jgi:curved DNA-binding protein CbpA
MEQKSRLLRITKGIGYQGFDDHYAILGLPITATERQVRDRYLTIAKRLHPDVCRLAAGDKDLATRYFARLVNPAYFALNRTRERAEYIKVLKLIPKLMLKRNQKITPQSGVAQKLASDPSQETYERAVTAISTVQFESMATFLDFAGDLSELNLVFLLSSEGCTHLIAKPSEEGDRTARAETSSTASSTPEQSRPARTGYYDTSAKAGTSRSMGSASVPPKPQADLTKAMAKKHLQEAQALISRRQWQDALKELRNALKLDNQNSQCHTLMGVVYMNQNFVGMAKASFQEALKLDPKDRVALDNLQKLDGKTPKKQSSSGDTQGNTQGKQGQDKKAPKKGGLSSWLPWW